MITNGRVRTEEPNVTASFSELAYDVIELSELQAQLFALDIKNTAQKTRTSALLSVIGICVLLGSIPVVLFALAELFVEQFEWSQSAGFGVAAAIGIVASGGILAAAWNRLSAGLSSMQRSREELSRNIAWIKASLRSRPVTGSTRKQSSSSGTPTNPR